jgi:hypothetical protein
LGKGALKKTERIQTTVISGRDSFKRVIIRKNFAKNCITVHCFVAGYRYHDGESIIDVLKPRERFNLVHELYNPYDENAVAVYTREYIQLGYIPRLIAPLVAKRLDAGKSVACCLKRLNAKEYHDAYVRIEIVLKIPM